MCNTLDVLGMPVALLNRMRGTKPIVRHLKLKPLTLRKLRSTLRYSLGEWDETSLGLDCGVLPLKNLTGSCEEARMAANRSRDHDDISPR